MAGWDLKEGLIKNESPTNDELWFAFNHFFSNTSKKHNSYKYALLKSILDNLLNVSKIDGRYKISFDLIFKKFTINYWNLINKYNLRQIINYKDGRKSKIEQIFEENLDITLSKEVSFDCLDVEKQLQIVKMVSKECSKYVVGALYTDLQGIVYSFSLKNKFISLSEAAYNFMLNHKIEIEKINYYEWAKFLESVNEDDVLIRVLDKLDLSTPQRRDLSFYRNLLYYECHQYSCFYCGCELAEKNNSIHVDHFIPWSYVKTDNLWNLVLSCNNCNTKKNAKLPSKNSLKRIIYRNEELKKVDIAEINEKIQNYSDSLITKIYNSAIQSGFVIDNRL